jgi:phosphoribosylamine--glycine ligase
MKIAVVGGGGREHALIQKLRQSPQCTEVVALPGNGGIAAEVCCVDMKPTDLDGIVRYCAHNGVDYVVVAPDDPLALGLVDRLAACGIPAFGPSKAAARIEASKAFAKALMREQGIPTADYAVFEQAEEAVAYIRSQNRFPIVIKADGLALGKGVLICQDLAQAKQAVESMLLDKKFGASGARIVVEEFLTGPEVSVLAFCDGERVVPMVSSMDHKRALEGDRGPNTGGMGAVAPNPYYTDAIAARCMEEIFMPTMAAMRRKGAHFKGCLYFGLMLTPDGPKVIEYNCRFGDPETQVVLPLLEGDLLEIMMACTAGNLTSRQVRFSKDHCACVIMASGGYPEHYESGFEIAGLDLAKQIPGVTVYHAGTRMQDHKIVTAGGRVLGVSACAQSLAKALERAYEAAEKIEYKDAHMRRDIGKAALSAQ